MIRKGCNHLDNILIFIFAVATCMSFTEEYSMSEISCCQNVTLQCETGAIQLEKYYYRHEEYANRCEEYGNTTLSAADLNSTLGCAGQARCILSLCPEKTKNCNCGIVNYTCVNTSTSALQTEPMTIPTTKTTLKSPETSTENSTAAVQTSRSSVTYTPVTMETSRSTSASVRTTSVTTEFSETTSEGEESEGGESDENTPPISTGLLIGVVGAALALLGSGAFIVCIIIKRRRSKRGNTKDSEDKINKDSSSSQNDYPTYVNNIAPDSPYSNVTEEEMKNAQHEYQDLRPRNENGKESLYSQLEPKIIANQTGDYYNEDALVQLGVDSAMYSNGK